MNSWVPYSLSLLLLTATAFESRALTVTGSDMGVTTAMPGSSTDFYMFGNSVATSDSNLTDFGVNIQPGTNAGNLGNNQSYGGNQYYSSIDLPGGSSPVLTGIVYLHSTYDPPNNDPANMVTVTLGNSGTFNYADFNLYVLYSNADVPTDEPGPGNEQTRDLGISVAEGDDATSSADTGYKFVSVSDTNTSTSDARYVEFNIEGLAAGDTFTIAAAPLNGAPAYIGGISFESVPEPSVYAMISCGLALLGLAGWNRRRLSLRA